MRITNPILPGFHPDPSIVKVDNTFYIANSTFEWFPGVEIWKSTNLRDWNFCTRPLNRVSQLDMRGVPSSGGVWAPCLSYSDDQFWLIYTNVLHWKVEQNPSAWYKYQDTPNYLVTAPAIDGPWSDPIYLNSSGFDPSLFHAPDGTKWLVNMRWDWREGANQFSGIVLQQYDHQQQRLIGDIRCIYKGTERGCTEGPHLHYKDGEYWLVVAEGGTSYLHATTVARSSYLEGQYTADPAGALCTAITDMKIGMNIERHWMEGAIDIDAAKVPSHFYDMPQKTGHGSLCHVDGDEWVLAHLMGRPLHGTAHCPLGRETGLQPVVWKQGEWPRLKYDAPRMSFDYAMATDSIDASTSSEPIDTISFTDTFDNETLHHRWQSLRVPVQRFANLKERQGWLRVYGQHSLQSRFDVSVVACRVQATTVTIETKCQFKSHNFLQQAGLVLRYDENNQLACGYYFDEDTDTAMVGVTYFDNGMLHSNYNPLPPTQQAQNEPITLWYTIEIVERAVRCYWKVDGDDEYTGCGTAYDSAKLSDEYASPMGFTGQFVGIYCTDVSGQRTYADFDSFTMRSSIADNQTQ